MQICVVSENKIWINVHDYLFYLNHLYIKPRGDVINVCSNTFETWLSDTDTIKITLGSENHYVQSQK